MSKILQQYVVRSKAFHNAPFSRIYPSEFTGDAFKKKGRANEEGYFRKQYSDLIKNLKKRITRIRDGGPKVVPSKEKPKTSKTVNKVPKKKACSFIYTHDVIWN